MAQCDQGWHVKSTTQMTTAAPTYPQWLLDRFSRLEKPWIQSAEGHPPACVQYIGQHGQFAQDLQSAGLEKRILKVIPLI